MALTACGALVARLEPPTPKPSATASRRESAEDPYAFVGAVLLREPTSVVPDDVIRAFELYGRAGQSIAVGSSDPSVGYLFSLSGCGTAGVAMVEVPHPDYAGELVRASIASLHGRTPELPHSAFHQVMLLPSRRPAPKATCQSHMVSFLAALAKATDAVGVVMENAIHEVSGFTHIAGATDGSMRPLPHLGFSLARENLTRRFSVLSWGMPSSFGLLDIIATQPDRGSALDAYELAMVVSLGVITDGARYNEGDTLGRDPHERLPVRLTESPVDPTAKVVRLDLP